MGNAMAKGRYLGLDVLVSYFSATLVLVLVTTAARLLDRAVKIYLLPESVEID
jgi:hypothetical protein